MKKTKQRAVCANCPTKDTCRVMYTTCQYFLDNANK